MSKQSVWTTKGFEDFSQGTCGNAGQNLYISWAGILQRIHQYDFNRDGYMDLIFCNSQNHGEKPPASIYKDIFGKKELIELPADGAWSGVVADLNGDGFDDLVIGNYYNGIRLDLNSTIYFGGSPFGGSPNGYSENRQHQLPAPLCSSVAAGDFNGDGRMDLAFICREAARKAGQVRIFYQSALGFEPKRYKDLEIHGEQAAAEDLDGDGCAELVVRTEKGEVSIYWGGPDGIDPQQVTQVPAEYYTSKHPATGKDEQARYTEYVEGAPPLVKIIYLPSQTPGAQAPGASGNQPYIFIARPESAFLVPVTSRQGFGTPLEFASPRALSIAAGDINGDGYTDLVLACQEPAPEGASTAQESSWVYWGGPQGFAENRRTRLPSLYACDVAVGDLDGDGYADIVLCQHHTADCFTTDSFAYKGSTDGTFGEPVRLQSHDARRVLLACPTSDPRPQVIFVNHFSRNLAGDVQPSIYFGGPDGFSPERRQDVPGWGAVEAICTDINDDGYVDLVLGNASENSVSRDPGSFILLNGPQGFGQKPSATLPSNRAHGVCCADINRDGYLDLIFCGFRNPELVIFYGTAASFDIEHPQRIRMEHEGVTYSEPRWIYLADLNNNGWLDLVVPQIEEDRSFILWGGPEGFSMERSQFLSVVRGACARAADLTGNGYLDLIIGGHMPDANGPHDSFVYIYWNGPDGLREDRRALLPAKTINAIAVADFNNDGKLDIFICSYHATTERDIDSYLYWNRPGKGFSAADRTRFFTHSASGVVAGDFNEDGWIDLAIAYHKVNGDHVGHSAVWWNGPDGFVEGRVTRLPSSGPHGMVAVGPGNIMDRGPEEYYTSRAYHLPDRAVTTEISWEADLAPKTWVKAQLRSAATQEALDIAPWTGPDGTDSWYENRQPVQAGARLGQWIQYRLALGATNSGGTPRVSAVNLTYAIPEG